MNPSRIGTAFIIACLLLMVPAAMADDIHGSVSEMEGQRILRLWGTHYEMGYAHGSLLAEEIVTLIDQYFIGQRWTVWSYENTIRPYVDEYFSLPSEYAEEFGGMLDGIHDAGASTYLVSVGRDLDSLDLHVTNLWGDFTNYLCSSVSAWGEMTFGDSALAGGTALVRNFEYPTGSGGILPLHSIVIAFDPSDSTENRWVSVAWPGFIGCLTGMNQNGLATATNGGDNTAPSAPQPHSLIGLFFSLRDAIENVDENGDGRHTIDDAVFAIDRDPRLGGLLTHVVAPFEPWQDEEPAVVVEMDSYGYVLRYGRHNLLPLHPIYSNDCLVITNSPILYMAPKTQMGRYAAMRDSLNKDLKVDTEKLWRMEKSISYPTTIHGVLFRPNLLDLFVAFGDSVQGAYYRPRVHWTWDVLFPEP